jgi:hypothetical protein
MPQGSRTRTEEEERKNKDAMNKKPKNWVLATGKMKGIGQGTKR